MAPERKKSERFAEQTASPTGTSMAEPSAFSSVIRHSWPTSGFWQAAASRRRSGARREGGRRVIAIIVSTERHPLQGSGARAVRAGARACEMRAHREFAGLDFPWLRCDGRDAHRDANAPPAAPPRRARARRRAADDARPGPLVAGEARGVARGEGPGARRRAGKPAGEAGGGP